MAHTVLDPMSIQAVGERIQDRSTGETLAFLQPNEGARLATPWSVALVRARHLADHLPTAEGWIVDPACGTGIQLAHMAWSPANRFWASNVTPIVLGRPRSTCAQRPQDGGWRMSHGLLEAGS